MSNDLSIKLAWTAQTFKSPTEVTLNLKRSLAIPKRLPIFSMDEFGNYWQPSLANLEVSAVYNFI